MITLKSHGFKFGRPHANMYFDVSYFKNPWRDETIRTALDSAKRKELIIAFMTNQEGCKDYVDSIATMIQTLHVLYPSENLQIALCCSAGEYRSPAMVELLSKELEDRDIFHTVKHSEYSKI